MRLSVTFLILLFNFTYSDIHFDVYGKSMKYSFSKDILSDVKCGFKTTKKFPGGIASCGGHLLQPFTGGYIGIKLFYRYGTIFRNYLFDFPKVEPCEVLKITRIVTYSNPLADAVVSAAKKLAPLFFHECPFDAGWYGIINVDLNASIVPYLPPVIPAGTYKLHLRYFQDNNVTLVDFEATGVVKANFANRAKDFSMLNMGR